MKTKKFEYKIQSAKRNAKSMLSRHYADTFDGIIIPHTYGMNERESEWASFGFILGSQFVEVLWQHPRHQMIDLVFDKAYENVIEKYMPDSVMSLLSKVAEDKFKEEFKTFVDTETLTTKPFVTPIMQEAFGKTLSICFPANPTSVADVVALAKSIRSHMKGEIDLMEQHAGYEYTLDEFREYAKTTGWYVTNE